MKVLILGGCADMAVPLVSVLKEDAEVTSVLLADINEEKVKVIAEENGPKFSFARCDAEETEEVVKLMKEVDAVFCYIGPFYYFEKKLAACAIEAGTDYISIADDYDAYLDVIELDDKARAAGVKILTGFGNSPGLTQILARKCYNDLKNVYKINVNWTAGSDEAAGPSNLTHLFHIFNGKTLQTFNGEEVWVKTGKGKKPVEFPEPIGRHHVYYTGHAESVSLPRNLSGLEEATLHGGVKPNYIVKLLKIMSALGFFKTHKRRAALAKFFYKIEGWFASEGIDKSVGRVDVYGRDGNREQYKYCTYVGHIAELTSFPAYLAGKWLFQKKFKDMPGGVYSGEKLLEKPDDFISELKALGVEIYESDIQDK